MIPYGLSSFNKSPAFMIIDILVAVVLLISCLIAFLRGFIRELLTIFGTVGALAAAYYAGPLASPVLRGWFGVVEGEPVPRLFDIVPYTIVADALAYGSIFIIVIIALSLISHALAESAKSIGLGAVDRTLGVFFGLARGAVLLGLLYLPIHLMVGEETKERWFEGSRTHIYMVVTAEALAGFLPEDTLDIERQQDKAREKLKDMELLNDPAKTIEQIQKSAPDGVDVEKLLKENAPNANSTMKEGYNDEFRQQMDKLFEQKAQPQGESAPSQ